MLNYIFGYLESAWDFLLNIITTMIMAVSFVVTSVQNTLLLVGYVPPIIGTALVITIAVFVVRFLLLK